MKINDQLSIGDGEISFTYSRSPGPGGQNVNKVATKATLWFDVRHSSSLSAGQRDRICEVLRGRINRNGMLRVSSWRNRTQAANRRDAILRFVNLLAETVRPTVVRKKTRPSRVSQKRRVEEKRRRSRQKQLRSRRITGAEEGV